jgi:isovaleryl-CoA dehydrogenase
MAVLPESLLSPSDEHALLRDTVRQWARSEVEAQAMEHDERGALNLALLRKAGDLGLLGVTIPEADGGAGLDPVASVIVHEELAYADPGFALAYLAHALLFVNNFYWAGNPSQRARYLPQGAVRRGGRRDGHDRAGRRHRRAGHGHDRPPRGRSLRAERPQDLHHQRPRGRVFCVYAKLDGKITTFVVERGFAGFATSPKIPKMGMRASTMSELMFDECRVPVDNLLGREGGGITNMMRNLEIERLGLAAMSVGMAQRCLDVMVRYSQERRSFGKPIHDLGQIQRYIGDSFAKLTAMRAMVYGVAATCGPDARNRLGTDAAKLFCATAAKEIADAAVQVLGGYGYCTEYRVEQFLRDAKLIEIGGGTLEAHQKNITRDLTAR